jgi:hypothetical protein
MGFQVGAQSGAAATGLANVSPTETIAQPHLIALSCRLGSLYWFTILARTEIDCDCITPFSVSGRGRYPGRLTVHVRRGLRETIGTAASRQGVSAAEWVRRILERGVSECAISASGSQSSLAENGGK